MSKKDRTDEVRNPVLKPRTKEAQLELLGRLQSNLLEYAPKCLKIKTKSGKLADFFFNEAQLFAHKQLEKQKAETGMVRALILKGRQQGFSTMVAGRFYHRTSLNHGVSVFILTHEQTATDNLFGMANRFHENSPLRPETGKANAKELMFPKLDGGYAVATAGKKAVGRSKTTQLFHGSEVAFWPNDKDHFASSVQSVPYEPGTEIILESTANGVGGEFFERWEKAEAGIGEYIAIFVPWFMSKEYRRTPPRDFKLHQAIQEKGEDVSETEYAELYELDAEQMYWRRLKIQELGHTLFKQEYPANSQEAFQKDDNDSLIDSVDVLRARKTTHEATGPLIVGVDPSRFGDDLFAIAWRRGRKVIKVEDKQKIDTLQAANWLKRIVDVDKPTKMFIDAGGGGAQIYDVVCGFGPEYEEILVLINFGGSAEEPEQLLSSGETRPGPLNRRAEMWERSNQWLKQDGGADIPDIGSLQRDACAPSYKYNTQQRLQLESKEAMRRRKVPSPDKWDAIALTFGSKVYDETLADGHEARKNQRNRRRAGRTGKRGWMSR